MLSILIGPPGQNELSTESAFAVQAARCESSSRFPWKREPPSGRSVRQRAQPLLFQSRRFYFPRLPPRLVRWESYEQPLHEAERHPDLQKPQECEICCLPAIAQRCCCRTQWPSRQLH